MRKPRGKTPGRTYTISATDGEWAAIGSGAERAGKPRAVWAVECALTVDPEPGRSRRLVLDEKQQRSISRGTEALARSLCADLEEPSGLADDLRALLAARLGEMVRQGLRKEAGDLLRETFGDERADIVIAAMMPEMEKTVKLADRAAETKPAVGKPATKRPRRKPERDDLDMDDLFSRGDRPPAAE